MQARMHAVLDHPGSKLSRGFLRYHPVEDQLHPIRAAQIQVVADDFLEELAAPQWPVENLRQAHFHLPDRQIPVVARNRSGTTKAPPRLARKALATQEQKKPTRRNSIAVKIEDHQLAGP